MARSNVFIVALVISTLFHLSMVSVFSIVIRFPTHGIRYFPLDIVERPIARKPVPMMRDLLRTPTPESLLAESQDDMPGKSLAEDAEEALPAVELPRLRLAESDPLRTPAESLRIRSQFSELFEQRQSDIPDSWALFTQQLREIGPTLSRTISGEPEQPSDIQKVATSASGFGVYLQWLSEPKKRKVLLAPPMQSLLSMDPASLDGPLVLVFVANAQGKVIEAHAPAVGENASAIESVRDALMGYVFEPLETGQLQDQRGTLIIKGEPSPQ